MSGLIWVQTVCEGYQQTTLVDKELKGKIELVRHVACWNLIRIYVSSADFFFFSK